MNLYFKKIKYNNYRPFINAEINFKHKNGITLLVGANGSGKSEILLSLLWVLYGEDPNLFTFKSLKGKDMVPYSLNQDIYKQLDSFKKVVDSASVELEFNADKEDWIITRKETFKKNPISKKMEIKTDIMLSKINPNGTTSSPARSQFQVDMLIEQILPKNIARALFFDGEKMADLSTGDKRDRETKALINTVADLDLLTSMKKHIDLTKREVDREISNHSPSEDINALIKSRDHYEAEIESEKVKLEAKKEKLDEAIKYINDFISRVEKIEYNQKLKDGLNNLYLEKKDYENKKNLIRKNLSQILSSDGYLYFTKKLFEDIERVINSESIKVPIGINSDVVKKLLNKEFKGGSCICGRDIDSKAETFMRELVQILPPEFKPTEIKNNVYHIKEKNKENKSIIINYYKKLSEIDVNLKNIEEKIKASSSKIVEISKEDKDKKIEFEKHFKNRDIYEIEIKNISSNIEDYRTKIKLIGKKLAIELGKQKKYDEALKKRSYLKALEELCDIIEVDEKISALEDINQYFKSAFKNISADLDESFEVEINEGFEIIKYIERDGIKQKRPNTTGQLKVLAMSFIKAISDFATSVESTDLLRRTKQYPVVIDAAFGDISDGNLEGVTKQLTNFDSQLIVLVASDQLSTFRKNIESSIVQEIKIIRKQKENVSFIEDTL